MDATLAVAIAGVAVPVGAGFLGWLWNAHSKRLEDLEAKNVTQDAAMRDMERRLNETIDEVDEKRAAFELQASKDFITQPALLQVMNSLDKTLSAMADVMRENQRETRAGLDALNKRIDNMFADKHKG